MVLKNATSIKLLITALVFLGLISALGYLIIKTVEEIREQNLLKNNNINTKK